jgi:TRAP-type C4-dicarboxylate transport system permease small subunit
MNTTFTMAGSLILFLSRMGLIAAGAITSLITAGILYDMFMRFFFAAPTVWSVELTSYGVVWIPCLAAAGLLARQEHVQISLLVDRLSPRARQVMSVIVAATIALSAATFLVTGLLWVSDTYSVGEVSDTMLEIPLVWVRVALPVGMLLLLLEALRQLSIAIKTLFQRTH